MLKGSRNNVMIFTLVMYRLIGNCRILVFYDIGIGSDKMYEIPDLIDTDCFRVLLATKMIYCNFN